MNFKTILLKSIIKLIPQKLYYKILKVHFFRKLKTYYKNDEFEKLEPDLDIIKLLIKPMDSVIDVGANFGFYTFYLSQLVGKYGHVYSMEPIPLTFEMLSYITRKLSLDNVSTFNYGISERNGSAIMEIPKFELGNDNFYEARITRNKNPDLKYFKVNLRSLDSLLFNKTNKITFIKIDVEGHELQVINGAAKLINSYKPAFLIEISENPDDRQSPAFKLFDRLINKGYQPYWYDGNILRPRLDGDTSTNYFFLTNEQFKKLEYGQ